MSLPSVRQQKACYRAFRQATSNRALQMRVCVVCARELMSREGEVQWISKLRAIKDVLAPERKFHAHKLYEGMLLVSEYISGSGKEAFAWICFDCMQFLENKKRPRLSLANNMWIGPVPEELSALTVPEQLLIAQNHPRCFIFKLYPKDSDHGFHPDHLHRGMLGNVSLYKLNTGAIVEMLEGRLMPHPGAILASVLAITFVGSRKLPDKWLKSTFRVRRRRIYEALEWLKNNNELYAGIEICHDRLIALPEDGVPEEILAGVRHESDGSLAVKEREGYVPEMEDVDDDMKGLDAEGVVVQHMRRRLC